MGRERREELPDSDFKYVIADMESIYLGARFTFGELLLQETVPFKLKAILNRYILKEADPDATLESQFYYLAPAGFLYEVFCQLRIRVKVNVRVKRKGLLGGERWVYKERVLKLKDLTAQEPEEKKACGMIVREIIVSKLGLMAFSV